MTLILCCPIILVSPCFLLSQGCAISSASWKRQWTLLKPPSLSHEGLSLWRVQIIGRKKKNLWRSGMYRIATSGWRNLRPRNGCRHPGISALLFFTPNAGRKINPLCPCTALPQVRMEPAPSRGCLQWQLGLLSPSTCFRFSFYF